MPDRSPDDADDTARRDTDNTGIGSGAAPPHATGGKTFARRLAQRAGGTGTPGHSGTGAEDRTATPGRVTAGDTAGGGVIGGSAVGDEGIGDTPSTTRTGFSGGRVGGTPGVPITEDDAVGEQGARETIERMEKRPGWNR